ncbi:MAG: hypothetical protein NTZ32_02680 [Planctomycetales bacterium]|jgi:hypothetical protein|nr:hypothetical protein [Planctomycetales bacterium]
MVKEMTEKHEATNTEHRYCQRIHSAVSTRILQVTAVDVSGSNARVKQLNRTLFDGPIRSIPNATEAVVLKRAGL